MMTGERMVVEIWESPGGMSWRGRGPGLPHWLMGNFCVGGGAYAYQRTGLQYLILCTTVLLSIAYHIHA